MSNSFQRISITEAKQKMADGPYQLADIRDEQSFNLGHIDTAVHVTNHNLQEFVESTDPDQPLLIYCYHGNSSQSAAQFFVEKDFTQVFSVDGGYEEWKTQTDS